MSVLASPPATCGGAAVSLRSRPLHAVPPVEGLPPVVGAGLVVPTISGPARYANLDHAASTPALVSVKAAVDRALETYASVHRGAGYASRLTSAWYEEARSDVAQFVRARSGDCVVFTRTTTDAWNLLAKALPGGTTVFVFESEHHSTLLPWGGRRTVRLPIPETIEDAAALLETALAEHHAPHRLVVIAAASNVTGEIWPVERFARLAHRHGARLAVDAAQLSAHRQIDLTGWDADYVAFSGHKTYAPFGSGALVGRTDWLDAGTPYLFGGGATRAVDGHGTTWATGPARHEGGSPNVIGAIALAAACANIGSHRTVIEEHESALLARLRYGLGSVPGVTQLSMFGSDHDRVGVVAFTVEGYDPSLVAQVLAAEHGIGVRDGRFCAHLLVDDLTRRTDERTPEARTPRSATAVRASIGLGTTPEAVDRCVDALRELVLVGPAGAWSHGAGGWTLGGHDPRDAEVVRPW